MAMQLAGWTILPRLYVHEIAVSSLNKDIL